VAALACGAAGCSTGQEVTAVGPAPSASAAACTDALALAPATVLGHPRTSFDVTGAAAWGPPDIVLRCGLPEPGPSSIQCLSIDDVDWLLDDRGDPVVYTTFGRAPAAQVRVSAQLPPSDASAALVDLRPVVAALPRTGRTCS
jgi:hypothetical protein